MDIEFHDVRGNGPYDCICMEKYFLMNREWPLWLYMYGQLFLMSRLNTKIHIWTATHHGDFNRYEFLLAFYHLGFLDWEDPDGNGGCSRSRAHIGGHREPRRLLWVLQGLTGVNIRRFQEATWEGSQWQIRTCRASTSLRQVKETYHRCGLGR